VTLCTASDVQKEQWCQQELQNVYVFAIMTTLRCPSMS